MPIRIGKWPIGSVKEARACGQLARLIVLANLVVTMSTPPRSPDSSDPQASRQPGSEWAQRSSAWSHGGSAWRQTSSSWNQPNEQSDAHGQDPATPPHANGSAASDELPVETTATQPSVSIQQFKTRRSKLAPILLALIAVVAFFGIWWLAVRPGTEAASEATPTPTAVRTMPSLPPSGEYANSTPFSANGLDGTFTINDSWWEGSTLSVDLTIQVDTGLLKYRLLVMDMASGDIQLMEAAPGPDGLSEGTLSAGESVTGVVQVDKTPGDSQIVLSQTNGNNLTMLAVRG
ncbi:MAG: hypothetical protein GX875_10390 [Propionibacterium sp.]|nr:hypothetical protein [Propionibacterium sp.]